AIGRHGDDDVRVGSTAQSGKGYQGQEQKCSQDGAVHSGLYHPRKPSYTQICRTVVKKRGQIPEEPSQAAACLSILLRRTLRERRRRWQTNDLPAPFRRAAWSVITRTGRADGTARSAEPRCPAPAPRADSQ